MNSPPMFVYYLCTEWTLNKSVLNKSTSILFIWPIAPPWLGLQVSEIQKPKKIITNIA